MPATNRACQIPAQPAVSQFEAHIRTFRHTPLEPLPGALGSHHGWLSRWVLPPELTAARCRSGNPPGLGLFPQAVPVSLVSRQYMVMADLLLGGIDLTGIRQEYNPAQVGAAAEEYAHQICTVQTVAHSILLCRAFSKYKHVQPPNLRCCCLPAALSGGSLSRHRAAQGVVLHPRHARGGRAPRAGRGGSHMLLLLYVRAQ